MEDAGVRVLYSLDFSQVRDWEAEAFVRQVLFERFQAKRLCCGEDFRFGREPREACPSWLPCVRRPA